VTFLALAKVPAISLEASIRRSSIKPAPAFSKEAEMISAAWLDISVDKGTVSKREARKNQVKYIHMNVSHTLHPQL